MISKSTNSIDEPENKAKLGNRAEILAGPYPVTPLTGSSRIRVDDGWTNISTRRLEKKE